MAERTNITNMENIIKGSMSHQTIKVIYKDTGFMKNNSGKSFKRESSNRINWINQGSDLVVFKYIAKTFYQDGICTIELFLRANVDFSVEFAYLFYSKVLLQIIYFPKIK